MNVFLASPCESVSICVLHPSSNHPIFVVNVTVAPASGAEFENTLTVKGIGALYPPQTRAISSGEMIISIPTSLTILPVVKFSHAQTKKNKRYQIPQQERL